MHQLEYCYIVVLYCYIGVNITNNVFSLINGGNFVTRKFNGDGLYIFIRGAVKSLA